jgi:N-acetylmuramoyl-L-alanine amidase
MNTNEPLQKITVILDPGHGKSTPGKRSPVLDDGRQLFEYQYTRALCNKIQELLLKDNIRSILTVLDDSDPSLSERAEIVNNIVKTENNKGNKCIFISVHGNAAGSGGWFAANGWEIYTTESQNNSDKLAKCFVDTFKDIFPDRKLRGHKEKNFTVIYKVNCVAVLTENFFYDNKSECKFMLSDECIELTSKLHVESIKKYFNN